MIIASSVMQYFAHVIDRSGETPDFCAANITRLIGAFLEQMREPIVRVLLPVRVKADKEMEERVFLNFVGRLGPRVDEHVQFDAT